MNAMWIQILCVICPAAATVLAVRVALQFFQLESYQLGGYFRTLRRSGVRAFLPGAVTALSGVAAGLILLPVGAGVSLAAGAASWALARRVKAKKALRFTPRVFRLLGWTAAASLAFSALCVWAAGMPLAALALPCLSPLVLAAGACLALPLEKLINALYLRDARRRLDRRPDLIRVGITGSYGKTSCKFMLATILSEKYRVLATPGSFNTSMGVTRIIREKLLPDHQVFIAEMGSRHPGDIRLLCRLVRPRYGILTAVGPQHLETFGSQEAICREKSELARWIPADGAMVFADDGGLCTGLYEKAAGPRHLSGERHEGLGLWAEDLETGPWGSRFMLCGDGCRIPCRTPLLGRHNIGNLLAAGTLARAMGMDVRSIARGMSKCTAVEHRLQLLGGTGGVTVIDDAFNSNPKGAAYALETLRGFRTGRRIVVTPGFVELGAKEEQLNRELGAQIARCADVAVLVGRRHTAPIAEGILAEGFAKENLHVVSDLAQSGEVLRPILCAGDTVLYENDLPDNYSE